MNGFPEHLIVVHDIAGDRVRVSAPAGAAWENLRSLGFAGDEGVPLSLVIASGDHRRQVLLDLIDLDAVFVDGPGWSPAEFARAHRDDVDPSLQFRTMAWRGPDDWYITSV